MTTIRREAPSPRRPPEQFPADDQTHDPGQDSARRRIDHLGDERARILRGSAGPIRVGTASWTDPTITKTTQFYPTGVSSAEARLRHYAARFPLVEVDSTYYAILAKRTAELWLARTPADFTFNVKAHALMTGQPTEVARLPVALRDALPPALAKRARIYATDLAPELMEEVWRLFLDSLEPLRSAGKLGAVLLQYPRWFIPTKANVAVLLGARERLGDIVGAVELRNRRWFGDERRTTERTLAFLADHDLPYVMVDGPQGLESSVPPVGAVTSPRLAVVRLHGRRADVWEAAGIPTVERYRYLYDPEQLQEWIPRILDAAVQARETHVLLNNCYGIYGVTNAMEMTQMLRESPMVLDN